ncbi:MAG: hypothetical protein ABI721_00915 [Candidatus Dojkabacteria bacterium]
MKIVKIEYISDIEDWSKSEDYRSIESDIKKGIQKVVWPKGSDGFFIDPASKGKGRGEGNGVKPIKETFIEHLESQGWSKELRINEDPVIKRGPLDAAKITPSGTFAVEWETGNISSSHRALNKICLGTLRGNLIGGALILPSKALYNFLTDRVGNYPEIEPYLPLWKSIPFPKGLIMIIVIEQDGLKEGVGRIPKGTDGRALL